MNILVTGGCGFIGTHLVNTLKSLGHNVITVDRKGNPTYKMDIADYEDNLDIHIKENIDVIYHLAAQPYGRGSEEDPFGDLHDNIQGTLAVCYLAKRKNVKQVIYTSSTAIYGNLKKAREGDYPNPLSNYAVSKLTGEYYLNKFAREVGFTSTVMRLWNTYGPGQDMSTPNKGVVFAFANQILDGNKRIEVTGSLDRYRDIIYVDDVVNALISVLRLTAQKFYTFNVCTGEMTTIKQLIYSIIYAYGGVPKEYEIVDIGGSKTDQDGCIGDNSHLYYSTGWTPVVPFHTGLVRFLAYVANEKNKQIELRKFYEGTRSGSITIPL